MLHYSTASDAIQANYFLLPKEKFDDFRYSYSCMSLMRRKYLVCEDYDDATTEEESSSELEDLVVDDNNSNYEYRTGMGRNNNDEVNKV